MHPIGFRLGRAVCAVAATFFLSLAAAGNASAQLAGDLIEYDVKASSGTLDNNHSEFPLNYTVEYDDGTMEDVSIQYDADACPAACVIERRTTAAGRTPVAFWWFGIRIPIGADVVCTPPDIFGGCWCLCLKWIEISWWPWQVRPIFIWYYDPCCR